MTDISWEHEAEARAALRAIVSDPEYGEAALSSAQTLSNLLKDLLPDAPREKRILVAAAEAGLAETLREHVAQGMDPVTAIRLTASSLEVSAPFPPDACTWVAGEIASAMGISQPASGSAGAPGSSPGSAPGSSPGGPLQGDDVAGALSTQIPGRDAGNAPGRAAGSQVPGSQVPQFQAPGYQAPGYQEPGYQPPGYQPPRYQAASPANAPQRGSIFPPPPANAPFGQAGRLGRGQAYPPAGSGYGPPRTNPLAITALVCGCAQFLLWFIILVPGFLAAIAALIFGIVAIRQVRARGEGGFGLAVAGISLGGLGVLGGLLWILIIGYSVGTQHH